MSMHGSEAKVLRKCRRLRRPHPLVFCSGELVPAVCGCFCIRTPHQLCRRHYLAYLRSDQVQVRRPGAGGREHRKAPHGVLSQRVAQNLPPSPAVPDCLSTLMRRCDQRLAAGSQRHWPRPAPLAPPARPPPPPPSE